MKYLLAFLRWALDLFAQRARQAGATQEREKISAESVAHQQRQNEVANRPVTNEALDKSLKDGTF